MAELIYRANPSQEVLDKYKHLVAETAEFMFSFADYDQLDGRYILKGAIPAQETLRASETINPPFELSYWHYAMGVAQQWRERDGLKRKVQWDELIDKLSPLAYQEDGLYLAELATGYITPSTTFAASAQMAVKDNDIAYANYVPFNATSYSQLTGQAEIIINSINIGWKDFILPLPYGKEFKAGYEYFYTVSFSSSHTRTYFDPIKGELKKVINNNFSLGKE